MRRRYKVSIIKASQATMETILDFFNARNGRLRGFRFKDWADFQGTDENLGTGDGSTTTFQLRKQYTSGGQTYHYTVRKPVTGTVTAKTGATLGGASSATISNVNTTTGVITLAVAPTNGHGVWATFEYDVPVRFDTDAAPVRPLSNTVFQLDFDLIEVRED